MTKTKNNPKGHNKNNRFNNDEYKQYINSIINTIFDDFNDTDNMKYKEKSLDKPHNYLRIRIVVNNKNFNEE